MDTTDAIRPAGFTRKQIILFVLLCVAIVPLLYAAIHFKSIIGKAAPVTCQEIQRVVITPGEIYTTTTGVPTEMSVLAYDLNDVLITEGVVYKWDISSGAIGTIQSKQDKGTFYPQGTGSGDISVQAKNACTKETSVSVIPVMVMPPSEPTFTAETSDPAGQEDKTHSAPSNKKFDQKDVPKVIEYMKTRERRNLLPVFPKTKSSSALYGTPIPTSIPVNAYFIQPILFLSSDQSETTGNSAAINTTFQLLKRWYSGPLEQNGSGYTFRASDAIIYRASQPFSYYKCPNHEMSCDSNDGIWGNVQEELGNAGYPLWSAGTIYVVFVKGASGWSGSNCGGGCLTGWPAPGPASNTGVAILGDWALDAITGTVNSDCVAAMGTACYRDPQRGAVGHELGHTFGLAHAMDLTGSIMYSWWDFPYTSLFGTLGNNEKDVLRAQSKFFSTQSCTPNNQVNQTTMPKSVKTKTQFSVSFTVTNYGFCKWKAISTDLRIVQNDVWGIKQKQVSRDTYPAWQQTFSLTLTAPALYYSVTSKIYNSIWQMRMSGVYFGAKMGGPITVTLR